MGNTKLNKNAKLKMQNAGLSCLSAAFTLVELIVVIVILAILSTIAFLSFNSQSSSARDSTRMSDMASIAKGLSVFQASSGKYPKPDRPVTIFSGSQVIGYQGEAGATVLPIIRLSAQGGKDPVKGAYYTYAVNGTLSRMQELGFLENPSPTSFDANPFNKAVAGISYASVYPYVKGDMLGAIVFQTGATSIIYTPIQETTSTGIDVLNTAQTAGFVAFRSNSQTAAAVDAALAISYTATGNTNSTGSTVTNYPTSCKEVLSKAAGSPSGNYIIRPDSAKSEFTAYCDMSTDGGGWTLIYSSLASSASNMTFTGGNVAKRSHTMFSSGIIVPLANISSEIYIMDTSGNYVRTKTGAIKPMQNLRGLKLLNSFYGDNVDNTTDWQGNRLSNLSWAWYNAGCQGNLKNSNYTYDTNGFYWGCGNSNGMHLGSSISNWVATAGFGNFDVLLR